MLKKLTSVETYDHPLVFVIFLLMMAVPVAIAGKVLLQKVGVQIPGIGNQ